MSATVTLPPGPKGSPLAGSLKPFADRRLDWLVESDHISTAVRQKSLRRQD